MREVTTCQYPLSFVSVCSANVDEGVNRCRNHRSGCPSVRGLYHRDNTSGRSATVSLYAGYSGHATYKVRLYGPQHELEKLAPNGGAFLTFKSRNGARAIRAAAAYVTGGAVLFNEAWK